MYFAAEQTAVSYAELCVSGDRVRRLNADGSSVDWGKAPAGNSYTALVYAVNKGDEMIVECSEVTSPDCKYEGFESCG